MIEVRHLTKRYGSHTAVSDLNFTIQNGVIYGFLGPNGAGRSTTMNIITGCLGATDGEVLVDRHSISEEPMLAKKRIGYLPERPRCIWKQTAKRTRSGTFCQAWRRLRSFPSGRGIRA